mgnify:FL=1
MQRITTKIIIGVLLIGGMQISQAQTTKHHSNSASKHKVQQKRIITKAHSDDYMDGTASYYARKFAGHKTTSGHHLDMDGFTAAHPTLPMGTKLKVTNLRNNKIVYVEVNDRMPKSSGHVIDLTTAGAKQIGINGLGQVHLDVIENGVFNNVMNGEISKVLISANPLLSESQALSIANQYTVATSNTESNSQTTKDATN